VTLNIAVLFIVCTWRKSSSDKTIGIHRYVTHSWKLKV